jgi:hypothetical protein
VPDPRTDKTTVATKLKEIVKELPKTVRISIAYMIGVSDT